MTETIELTSMLKVQQRLQWQRGERILVETYLTQHPELRTDPQAVLDLIINEVMERRQQGELPNISEYGRRFADLEPQLRFHFDALQGLNQLPLTRQVSVAPFQPSALTVSTPVSEATAKCPI